VEHDVVAGHEINRITDSREKLTHSAIETRWRREDFG
jgi:hypothetical protein